MAAIVGLGPMGGAAIGVELRRVGIGAMAEILDLSDLRVPQPVDDIAGKIEKELTYPGQIKVTMIRESRFVEYAK